MKTSPPKLISVTNTAALIAATLFALASALAGFLSSIASLEEIHTTCSKISLTTALIAAIAGAISLITSTLQSKLKDEEIAKAHNKSIIAEKLANQAETNSIQLSKQNLELSDQLNLEIQKRLAIEKKLGKRKLSPEQILILENSISAIGEKPLVLLQITQQEDEVIEYSSQISDALTKAGAKVETSNTHLIIGGGRNTGVTVSIMQGSGHEELEQAIRAANFYSEINNFIPDPLRPTSFDPYKYAVRISIFPKPPHI